MEAIFNTVSSVIVSNIETRLIARNSNETRLTSLATFCEELALFHGPDDAIAKVPPRNGANSFNGSNSGGGQSRKRGRENHDGDRRAASGRDNDKGSNKRTNKYYCKKC
ncbi:hypothetical protein BGZ51_006181, partial [Haplosporangium sp. Z 767]